jgi:peptidoglycan/LPS O-acetylase OafA/YrhL
MSPVGLGLKTTHPDLHERHAAMAHPVTGLRSPRPSRWRWARWALAWLLLAAGFLVVFRLADARGDLAAAGHPYAAWALGADVRQLRHAARKAWRRGDTALARQLWGLALVSATDAATASRVAIGVAKAAGPCDVMAGALGIAEGLPHGGPRDARLVEAARVLVTHCGAPAPSACIPPRDCALDD